MIEGRKSIALHLALIGVCVAVFFAKFWGNVTVIMLFEQHVLFVKLLRENPDFVSAGMMGGYELPFSLYYEVSSRLLDVMSYAAYARTAFIVIGSLVVVFTYLFGLALSGSAVSAFLTTFVLFNLELLALPQFGANGLPSMAPYLYWLTFGVLLFALYFGVRQRPYLLTGVLAAAVLVHPAQGPIAYLVLTPAAWLLSDRNNRYLAFHVGVGIVLAGLLLATTPSQLGSADPGDTQFYFHALTLFNSGHVFVDAGVGYWTPLQCFLWVYCAGLAVSLTSREGERLLLPTLVTGGLVIAVSVYLTYVVPLRIVYQLLPLRISTLLAGLSAIFCLLYLTRVVAVSRHPLALVIATLACGGAAVASQLGLLALTIGVCVLAAADTVGWRRVVGIAMAVTIAAIALVYARGSLVPSGSRAILFLATGGACALYLSSRFAAGWRGYRSAVAGAGISAFVVAATLAPAMYDYSLNTDWKARLEDFWAISDWLAANTPPDQPVLTSPLYEMPYLEVTAQRGSVLQISKVAWGYSSPSLLRGLDTTLRDFGIDIRRYSDHTSMRAGATADWRKNTASDFVRLAEKYNASCLVTDADFPLDLPVLRKGRFFQVYGVRR